MLSEKFNENISRNIPFVAGKKILLAVSGGMDSMVMMHLFYTAGFNCEVAHCNFQLRGDESDADEKFVEQISGNYKFRFHSKKFDTREHAEKNSISIQMAARQLRYHWFESLSIDINSDQIAIAHHANDSAETMLLNLVKGTGLAGMHGIRSIKGKIIRPLLFASRKEIETFAAQQNLLWREDASNRDSYYLRNKLRLHVMPVLEEINPEVISAMQHHAKLMSGYEALIETFINELAGSFASPAYNDTVKVIAFDKLMKTAAPAIVLFHLLRYTGAGAALCEEITTSVNSGAIFYSGEYKIFRDRETITVFSPQFKNTDNFFLNTDDCELNLHFGTLKISGHTLNNPDEMSLLPGFGLNESAFIDATTLKFPLEIRKWQTGDAFIPLGMKGRKLISDFFVDCKFSSLMKETVYLLLSDHEVVWIMGHRPDERFKINKTTKDVLQFTYTANPK